MIKKIMKLFGYIKYSVANRRVNELFRENSVLKEMLGKYGVEFHGENIVSDFDDDNKRQLYYADVAEKFEFEVKELRKVNKKYKEQFAGMQLKIDKQALRLGDKKSG